MSAMEACAVELIRHAMTGFGAQGKYDASQRNFRSALIKQPFVAPSSRGEGGLNLSHPSGV